MNNLSKYIQLIERRFLIFLIVMFFSPACFNYKELDQEYDAEVINYFYETAFHTDDGQILDEAYRWTGDIPVSLHGIQWENDSLFVLDAIGEINGLGLPVSLYLTPDRDISRIKIYFGDNEAVEDSLNRVVDRKNTNPNLNFSGTVHWRASSSGKMQTAGIGISNNASIYRNLDSAQRLVFRKRAILEEIFQSMGIHGDSFTHYNSRVYEGKNITDSLSILDKKVLKFLYDYRVFGKRVKRIEFEKKYAGVLYNQLSKEKFRQLSVEYGLKRHDLDSIGQMVFFSDNGEKFIKFPRNAFLKLSGDTTGTDREFCAAFVKRLNTLTPYFQISLEEDDTMWNQHPSLTINYENKEEYKGTIYTQMAVTSFPMMYEYQLIGDIQVRLYGPDRKAATQVNEMVARAVFKALGLYVREELLTNNSLDSLEISEKYRNYFRFLYDPRFPSGISKEEFEELVKEIN